MKVLAVGAVAAALSTSAFAQPPAQQFPGGPPGPGGGRGGPNAAEVKLVKRFDKDGDKRLNAAERKEAREYMLAAGIGGRGPMGGPGGPGGQPGGGPGGQGGRGMRGGMGGPPGMGNQFSEPPTPGKHLTPADVKSYGANTPIYDANTIRTFFLEFESADWEKELEAFYNTDVEVPANVTVDGKLYKDVGVHFRGASSYFSIPAGRKRSLNLSFDFANDSQKLGGYATFNLLNANTDPSFLRTVLYHQISRNYIPAPNANFVRVVINGENWGIYPSAQQFNKDFTRDFFKSVAGARWKVPGSPQGRGGLEYLGPNKGAYERIYELKSKDDSASWASLIELTRVLNQTEPEKLEKALAPIFDVDGALKFLALENVFVNEDGYWIRASDYSIYRDEKGVFHITPHDANETFFSGRGGGRGRGGPPGGFAGGGPPPDGMGPPGGMRGGPPDGRGGFGGPGGPGGPGGMGAMGPTLEPLTGADNPNRALLSKLLAAPQLRTRYLKYVHDIAEKWLDWGTLGPIVEKYQALIAADVREDTRKLSPNEAFEGSAAELKRFADQRRAFLLNHDEVRKAVGK